MARKLITLPLAATLLFPLGAGVGVAGSARDQLILTGQVCALGTGQPIADARVGAENTWTQVGADGSFHLTLPPAEHLFLRAAAPGFQSSDLVTVSAAAGGILTGPAAFSFCGKLALAGAFTSADNAVKIVPVNQMQSATPHNVTLIGSTTDALEAKAAIQLPNGRVILNQLRRQGKVFICQVPIHYGPGRYLVEINAGAGFALIKLPLFAGVGFQLPAAPPPYAADTAGLTIDQVRELAFKDLNQQRAMAKLPPLREDVRLMRETQAHSDDVAAGGFIGRHAHIGSNGSTPASRVKASGVSFRMVAEDVGLGQTMGEIIFGLMDSPAHRWAILGNFTKAGIGVARLGANYTLTVDFVLP
ncbi:MAG: CAP domain-containing protein [Chloroflexota bacterium]